MKKIVITYGLIAGFIVTAWMLITISIGFEKVMVSDIGMYLGFTAMIVAFAFIFVAVKNYRDNYNGGWISFGTAFKIGVYVSLIASTIYVISWLIDYYVFVPDFMEKYTAVTIEKMKASGTPAVEVQAKAKEMAEFGEMYKNNPLVCALFTYVEILPVGLLISLVAALILKRKPTAQLGV